MPYLFGCMRVVFVLLVIASTASAAGSGICFLDTVLSSLNFILDAITGGAPTSTTTTTTTSTTTTTESTTTTVTIQPLRIITTTTTTSTATTTTAFTGECMSTEDCPKSEVVYKCSFDGDLIRETRIFYCVDPGPESVCKSQQKQQVERNCARSERCDAENRTCTRK